MAATIDGRAHALRLRARVRAVTDTLDFQPGLAVVLVGNDAASAVYVRNKDRAATEAGLAVRTVRLPATTALAELLAVIAALNDDDAVDGILVQLPLPPALDAAVAIAAIDPAKDVDGLTLVNAGGVVDGRVVMSLARPDGTVMAPCTPRGVMVLLADACPDLAGMTAVVLGRSALVGRPVASLLLAANATVTVVHSRTRDVAAECRRADVLVAAIGRAEFVRAECIKPGAVIIDVGINRLADGRLVGDVDTAGCAAVAAAITPVPGGVGPMTIACLLENTVCAAMRRRGVAVDAQS